jgi:hypothetical protein
MASDPAMEVNSLGPKTLWFQGTLAGRRLLERQSLRRNWRSSALAAAKTANLQGSFTSRCQGSARRVAALSYDENETGSAA